MAGEAEDKNENAQAPVTDDEFFNSEAETLIVRELVNTPTSTPEKKAKETAPQALGKDDAKASADSDPDDEDEDGDFEDDDPDDEDEDEDEDDGKGLSDLLKDGEDEEDEDGDAEDGGSDEDEDEDEEDEKPKKRHKSVSQRIKDLTKQRREAERRALAAEARAAELEKSLTKPSDDAKNKAGDQGNPDDSPEAPKPEDFTYGEFDPEYQKAVRAYDREVVKREVQADLENQRQAEAAQRKHDEIMAKYETVKSEGRKLFKDFDTVVVEGADKGKYPLSPTVAELALNSDVGHLVIYDIAKNPRSARELHAMTEIEQAAAFGRLEAKYQARAKAKGSKPPVSAAPKPPKKVSRGAATKGSIDPKTADVLTLEKDLRSKGIL